jgi:transcriptional regulator with XRE-family HTH domain
MTKERLNVGGYLSQLRINSGYKSLRRLGSKSGVSYSTLSRIEANIQFPLPGTLLRLAPYLKDVTYDELMKACGYLDKGNYAEPLCLTEESALIEELRSYPDFYLELTREPKMIETLYKLWKAAKDI